MIIALTGFMASGKSSTGHALAERLGWEFIDLDELCETTAGKTIAEIFEEGGETLFRRIEVKCLRQALCSAKENLVLALGGGTLLQGEAMDLLRGRCICVYLKASPESLLQRLSGDNGGKRPLLGGEKLERRIPQLLAQREAGYGEMAEFCVNTDGLGAPEAAEIICKKLNINEKQ